MLSQDDRRALILGLIRSFDAASFTRFVRLLRQEKGTPALALSGIPGGRLVPQPGTPGPAPAVMVELVDRWCDHGLTTVLQALDAARRACGGHLDAQLQPVIARLQAEATRGAPPLAALEDADEDDDPWADVATQAVGLRAARPAPSAGLSDADLSTWEPVPGRDDDWGDGEHTSVVDASMWQALDSDPAPVDGRAPGPRSYVVGAGDVEYEATQAKTVGYLLEDLDLDELAGGGPTPDPDAEITGDTPSLDLPQSDDGLTAALTPEDDGEEDAEERTVALGPEARAALAALRQKGTQGPGGSGGRAAPDHQSRPPLAASDDDEDDAPGPPTVRSAAFDEPFGRPDPLQSTAKLQALTSLEATGETTAPPGPPPEGYATRILPAVGSGDIPAASGATPPDEPTLAPRQVGGRGGPPPQDDLSPPTVETPRPVAPAPRPVATAPRPAAPPPPAAAQRPTGVSPRPDDPIPTVETARAGWPGEDLPTTTTPRMEPLPGVAPQRGAPAQREAAPPRPPSSPSAPSASAPRPPAPPMPEVRPATVDEIRYLSHVKATSGGLVELSFSGIPEGLHALRIQGEDLHPLGTLSFDGRPGHRGLDTCYGRQAYVWFNPDELEDLLHRKVRYHGPDGRSSPPMSILKSQGQSARDVTPEVPPGAAWVPPGVYLFPSSTEAHVRREKYDQGVFLGIHPVTHSDYQRFLAATGYQPRNDTDFLRQRVEDQMPPALADHPVVYVSHADARAYAQWVGGRLPTEAEWQRAVSGLDGRPFPWGSEMDPERLNSREARRGWTHPVGALPAGRGPFGHQDLLGNVWEWTDTEDPATDPPHKVIKGGAWVSGLALAHVDVRSWALPTARQFFIGFRVAWDRPGGGEETLSS